MRMAALSRKNDQNFYVRTLYAPIRLHHTYAFVRTLVYSSVLYDPLPYLICGLVGEAVGIRRRLRVPVLVADSQSFPSGLFVLYTFGRPPPRLTISTNSSLSSFMYPFPL